MHIAIITAGGAGMFCGSCMHDNTWARALMQAGCEVTLLPTYTPIRVDEDNLSTSRVFYGGLNVYLESMIPAWGRIPRLFTRWLDRPGLIRWATKFSISNDAKQLGKLTLEMLAGEQGPHWRAGKELADYLVNDLRPDVVIFSNALLVGALKELKGRFNGPVFCTLQGDDVFLDSLPDNYRQQAIDAISSRGAEFDGYFVHSQFYRDYISTYLQLPVDRFRQLPLSIDLEHHTGQPGSTALKSDVGTVGYFARIAPEKGLLELVEAILLLRQKLPDVQLKVGGYLGGAQKSYYEKVRRVAAPLGASFNYIGSPDAHYEKVEFLTSLDVLSVPTVFLEPKGLYAVEAMANGVPIIQPRHGAFPELIDATGGGTLVTPGRPQELADALHHLLTNHEERQHLGRTGQQRVRELYSPQRLATATIDHLRAALDQATTPESPHEGTK